MNMSYETNALQGPWTTLVKGRGLGATTRNFKPEHALNIQKTFQLLRNALGHEHTYIEFFNELTKLCLDFNNPACLHFMRSEIEPKTHHILMKLSNIDNNADYISAASILFETFGKIGLDPQVLLKHGIIDNTLNKIEKLPQNTSEEKYKALQAYGNIFLGLSHIGLQKVILDSHVNKAIGIANNMDDVWYKGRASAAFFTVMGMIGLTDYIESSSEKHLASLFDFLAESLEDQEAVKSSPNKYVFAILLSINCIATLGKSQYLHYRYDWLKVSEDLIKTLTPDLQIIFKNYYISALKNLGKIDEHINDTEEYVNNLMTEFMQVENSEISYMAYTYLIDMAHRLNLKKLISDKFINKFILSIDHKYSLEKNHMPQNRLYASGFMRIAYSFSALSSINRTEILFSEQFIPGQSIFETLTNEHINNWQGDYESLAFVCHSLLDLALSMRGENADDSTIDRHLSSNKIFGKPAERFEQYNISNDKNDIFIHAFFPGMNSRRSYTNLARDLYYDGTDETKLIFEKSARALGYKKEDGKLDISRFFMEEKHFPEETIAKWNYIGSAMTVYNLALFNHLIDTNKRIKIASYGGESFGIIAAAIASGSVTLKDGLEIANSTLGFIYKTAHNINSGTWRIISLKGKAVDYAAKVAEKKFKKKIDIFRWHALGEKESEIHVYVASDDYGEIKSFLIKNFDIHCEEFKRPTKEIIHSPKLAQARIDIIKHFFKKNIHFMDPKAPIIANNGTNILTTGEDVRQSILDMVDIPMYTAQAMHVIKQTQGIDAVIEIGYGQKTRHLIKQNDVDIIFTEYFGDRYRLEAISMDLKHVSNFKNQTNIIPLEANGEYV